MLLITTLLPLTSATQEQTAQPALAVRHVFRHCYVNATGLIYNVMIKSFYSGQIFNHAFAVYWLCQWDGDNTSYPTHLTIYSEKGGDVLWTNEGDLGIWAVKMFLYRGAYTYSKTPDGRPIVHLEGKVLKIVELNDL